MLPINGQPFDINDNVCSNLEIREVVRELRNGRTAEAMGLQAKHVAAGRGAGGERADNCGATNGIILYS
jgi:hypothetical protein